MPGANCSLDLLEIILTKHRNPEETEDDMALASSKDTSSSGVLIRVCEDRIKTMLSLQLSGSKEE